MELKPLASDGLLDSQNVGAQVSQFAKPLPRADAQGKRWNLSRLAAALRYSNLLAEPGGRTTAVELRLTAAEEDTRLRAGPMLERMKTQHDGPARSALPHPRAAC